MKKSEVVQLLAIITAAFPSMQIAEATVEVWYELLNDLDFTVAAAAVKQLLATMSHIPTIADIRRVAADITMPLGEKVDPATAWSEVVRAVHNYGYYRQAEALASMSPKVAEVVKDMGWQEICTSDKLDVVRGQFTKLYEQKLAADKTNRLLPPSLRQQIASLSSRNIMPICQDFSCLQLNNLV